MQNETNLKNFTEVFFNNLKCKVSSEGNALLIENVPADIEKLYGKKSPYKLVFEKEHLNSENELVAKGSSLLKIMAGYLDNKAQMSLLKINFNPDFKKEISERFNLNGHELTGISTKIRNDLIFRFTFLTNFQYLNEREQLINSIYVKDDSIIEFHPENYDTTDGKKEEIKLPEVKDKYGIAKEKLKELISKKTEEISKELNQSLEIETRRIKSHYLHQIDEINKELDKNTENIKSLEKKLLKANDNDKKSIQDKIERIKIVIENLKNDGEREKLSKEEIFFINDEKHKHSLNISNTVMNTTIIYYPVYRLKFGLVKKNISSRHVEIIYDPMNNSIEKLFCDSCKSEIDEIFVCSSGHINCEKCMRVCNDCRNLKCVSCAKITCHACGRDICDKCKVKCSKCLNYCCSADISKDAFTYKPICTKCSKYCQVCGKFSDKMMFSKCSTCGKEICPKCSKRDMTTRKNQCANCYRPGF
ncbi:MAG: hypothetical protein WC979_07270 [Candidatus Pacearchaeota archaeon]|jgi:hypothetical protein